jgi:hypothetical protein
MKSHILSAITLTLLKFWVVIKCIIIQQFTHCAVARFQSFHYPSTFTNVLFKFLTVLPKSALFKESEILEKLPDILLVTAPLISVLFSSSIEIVRKRYETVPLFCLIQLDYFSNPPVLFI